MSVEFQYNTVVVLARFERNKAKALVSVGIHAQRRAKEEITRMGAIDTGRLRASIAYQAEPANDEVIIGTPVEYAIYVHEGTRKMTGRPFIKEAVLNYQGDYKKIIEQTLVEGIGQ